MEVLGLVHLSEPTSFVWCPARPDVPRIYSHLSSHTQCHRLSNPNPAYFLPGWEPIWIYTWQLEDEMRRQISSLASLGSELWSWNKNSIFILFLLPLLSQPVCGIQHYAKQSTKVRGAYHLERSRDGDLLGAWMYFNMVMEVHWLTNLHNIHINIAGQKETEKKCTTSSFRCTDWKKENKGGCSFFLSFYFSFLSIDKNKSMRLFSYFLSLPFRRNTDFDRYKCKQSIVLSGLFSVLNPLSCH